MTEDSDQVEVSTRRQDGAVVVSGRGCMDLTNCSEFEEKLIAAATDEDAVTADLQCSEFVDSAVLAVISGAGKLLRDRQKRLKVVVAEGSHPHRVMQVLNLGVLVEIVVAPGCEHAGN